MPDVLYRKYRSQNFSEIYGQDAIVKVLKQAIKDEKVAHAYLFTGPRGTGKTSTARILAKALNCSNPKNGEPCNKCSSCEAVASGSFLDLIEIDAASNRGIDEIRDLKEKVGFLPAEGKYKIYIIDEVHMLTMEAFNALLKTLEEPPNNVVFVLATTEAHKLPLTIISRTQRFDFNSAASGELQKKLSKVLEGEGIEFEEDALELIINAGNGSFRDAETVLEKVIASYGYQKDKIINREDVEQALGYASKDVVNDFYEAIINENLSKSLQILSQADEAGMNLAQLIKQLLERTRRQLVTVVADGSGSSSDIRKLATIIKEFTEAANKQATALIAILPYEIALLKIIGHENQGNVAVKKSTQVTTDSTVATKVPEAKITKPTKPEKKETVIKQEVKAEPKPQSSTKTKLQKKVKVGEVTLADVEQNWKQIIENAKEINQNMAAMLNSSDLVDLSENTLKIFVSSSFHKKMLEKSSSQEKFNQLTESVLGVGLGVKCEVKSKKESKAEKGGKSNDDIVEEVFFS